MINILLIEPKGSINNYYKLHAYSGQENLRRIKGLTLYLILYIMKNILIWGFWRMLKKPYPLTILACLILFGLAEMAGAILGGYPQQVKEAASRIIINHPSAHGLVGVQDIDRVIIERTSTEVLARLHTFHLHGHGLAIVVFIISLIVINIEITDRYKKRLTLLISMGLLYPFGWLLFTILIPFLGRQNSFSLAEKIFFMPFGGLFFLSILVSIFFALTEVIKNIKGRETS